MTAAAPPPKPRAFRLRARERWMPLLSRVSAGLLGEAEPALSEILANLGEGLGAESVSLLEWSGEPSPLVVASWGQVTVAGTRDQMPQGLAEAIRAKGAAAALLSGLDGGPPPLARAVAVARGAAPRALVVAGEFPPPRVGWPAS